MVDTIEIGAHVRGQRTRGRLHSRTGNASTRHAEQEEYRKKKGDAPASAASVYREAETCPSSHK
jgi:hypothetical protein